MDENIAKQLVADTGRGLLSEGLVARTWGNISVRIDDTHFAISPSGLGYISMSSSDVPIYDFVNDSYVGSRKPSSEKKVHAAAYRIFKDAGVVIHTHQDYATVVGLVGTKELELTEEEKEILGEVKVAPYGLPGTTKLSGNVENTMAAGAQVVLMAHHGVVVVANDMGEAMKKVRTLEEVCKRAVISKIGDKSEEKAEALSESTLKALGNAEVVTDSDLIKVSLTGSFSPQIDDMAQMLGTKIRVVDNKESSILSALSKTGAVIVKGAGAVIKTGDPEDAEALRLLLIKSAVAKRYTKACGKDIKLSWLDCRKMRSIYVKTYSKQMKG